MVEIIKILITVEEIFDRGTILKKNLKTVNPITNIKIIIIARTNL